MERSKNVSGSGLILCLESQGGQTTASKRANESDKLTDLEEESSGIKEGRPLSLGPEILIVE